MRSSRGIQENIIGLLFSDLALRVVLSSEGQLLNHYVAVLIVST